MKRNLKYIIISTICSLLVLIIFIIIFIYIKPILITDNKNLDSNISVLKQISYVDGQASVKRITTKVITKKAPPTISSFYENFDTEFTITEEGRLNYSKNQGWWLNSGAYVYSSQGEGQTISGELPTIDPWRFAYYVSNPLDTDNGYHPQNIFRLVEKNIWKNYKQEVNFKIIKNNLSNSPNRNASNGLLLFNRYQDQNNLYYTGIRVDGYAVIKKKINGRYYTMAYNSIFKNEKEYNRDSNPNLLPLDSWIGVKSEVITKNDNTVNIKVYVDRDKTGNWILVAEANDNGKEYGGDAIIHGGLAGIRTDFMDVIFDDYKIISI